MNLTTLFKSHLEEQIYGQRQGVEEGEGEMIGEKSMEAYTLPYVKKPMGICAMTQGTQTGAL